MDMVYLCSDVWRIYVFNLFKKTIKKFFRLISTLISNIAYDQGDYSLDNFSVGKNILKIDKLDLQGFKRSYFEVGIYIISILPVLTDRFGCAQFLGCQK